MEKNKLIFFLIAIILAGGFLRFYGLGRESLWLDEAATGLTLKKYGYNQIMTNTVKLGQILPGYYSSNLDLPTYYIMMKFWTEIFGLNDAVLRSMSAIFGTLSIILVYLLAEEMFGTKIGLMSALIFSLNVIMIDISQEGRLYSFLIFIAILSSYLFIKFLKTDKSFYFAALVISNIIGIYTHYPFIFFVVFEISYLLYLIFLDTGKRKVQNSKLFILIIILGALYLPLLPRLLNPKLVSADYAGSLSLDKPVKIFLRLSTWLYPDVELKNKINNLQFNMLGLYDWAQITSVAAIAILLFSFFVRASIRIIGRERKLLVFLLMWVALPLITASVVLYRNLVANGEPRSVIFIVPAYLTVAAIGMSSISQKKLSLLLMVFLFSSILVLTSFYSNHYKPQYRDAAAFLDKKVGNDLVILDIPSVKAAFDYYSDKSGQSHGASNAEDARQVAMGHDSVWLVLSFTKYYDQGNSVQSFFDKNYKLTEEKDFFDVNVYHYSKKVI